MAKIKLGIDKYHPDEKGRVVVRLEFSSKSKMAPFSLEVKIKPENWDKENETILPTEPRFKSKNKIIEECFEDYRNRFEELYYTGKLPTDPYKMRDVVTKEKSEITFLDYYKEKMSLITNKHTKSIYKTTYNLIYKKEKGKNNLDFSDITVGWLKSFSNYYLQRGEGNSINGLGVNLRNIRKIFNDAIDDELISYDKYPFRRFKIKRTATKHRNIPIERLREMLHFNQQEFIEREKLTANKHTSVFPNVQKYLDLFFLSFYLCGINIKDLLFLKSEDIVNGQLSILRAKTNTHILLKIEPEAQTLMDKYKGKKYLLNFLDTYKTDDYKTFLSKMKASIYINRNLKKVSQANRKVIDYLHGKIDIE